MISFTGGCVSCCTDWWCRLSILLSISTLPERRILVLFAGRVDGFIGFMVLAWLVSPYGLPLAASWLTERVADFNRMLKSI